MPICRTNFDGSTKDLKNVKNDTFNDNDEVFFCEVTKEIFRDYEDYFRHVMVINSTVWQCEATGRENLTYAEALKSEKRARKKMEQFKESLRAPVMLVIESAKQSSMNMLCTITAKFLRKRYFLNEIITVIKSPNSEYKVLDIQLPNESTSINDDIVYEETENLIYKVQRLNGSGTEKDIILVPFGGIRRQRMEFTTESLQMFIKHNVTRFDGILRPKPESYKKYVTDHNISFKSLFIGKMPHFTPAKIRRPHQSDGSSGVKKQSTMNKYLVKNNDETTITTTNAKPKVSAEQKEKDKAEQAEQKVKSLKEQMERLRMEKLLKIAKMEKEKMEKSERLKEKITAECDALLNKTDDLERTDQRLLPNYRPVNTYIDAGILGDAFMIREFMHSFRGILSGIEVFRDNLNFYEMSRAFSIHEVIGPLSDILLILLGTIFDMQKEEDRECSIEYSIPSYHLQKQEPYSSMTLATLTHLKTRRSFSFKINELPIDALTVSEVLRLHLLSSGAAVKDRTEKWRIMYRNGYNSIEDPGFHFVKNHPRILRALASYPIYQLEFPDIINLIQCLIAQILTYSSPINLIEERLEQQAIARKELKNITFIENRRLTNVQNQRRLLMTDHNQQCLDLKENIEEQKRILEDKLNRKVADLLAQSEREHRKYEEQTEKLNTELFDFLLFVGTDRAYRKYYVLESLPGIFIEHNNNDIIDTCLSEPPINTLPGILKSKFNAAATLPRNRKDLLAFLKKFYKDEEKANEIREAGKKTASSIDNKENQENRLTNGMEALPNGHISDKADKTDKADNDDDENDENDDERKKLNESNKPPTQTELYMCSGDPKNCIVHSERHSERKNWSYIYQQDDINALIDSLNPLGERESNLREQLISFRTLIFEHSKMCPHNLLTITDRNKFKTNMLTETYRKYSRSNYGLNDVKDMGLVMHFALVEKILQFEIDIYAGDLGRLKVKDMERWRDGVLNNKYDSQATLHWGFSTQNNAIGGEDVEIVETNDEFKEILYQGHRFIPGLQLTMERCDDENGNDSSLDLKKETLDTLQKTVRDLASALLQVEQAIERRFFKEPYGTAEMKGKDLKDKELMERKQKKAAYCIKHWETSLMESTSFSQVFLHLYVLHDCIVWSRSTTKSRCQICWRGSDPEKMLLCDECNGGTHMYCMKPKMKKVPEGNWYCQRCVARLGLVNEIQQKEKRREPKRRFIMDDADNNSETSSLSERKQSKSSTNRSSRKHLPDNEIEEMLADNSENDDDNDEEEENEDEDNENSDNDDSPVEDESVQEGGNVSDSEDEEETENGTVDNQSTNTNNDDDEEGDEAICHICSYDGSDLFCSKCKDGFHLECVNLRRPPRYIFVCQNCRTKEQSKRKHQNDGELTENDDEDDNSEIHQQNAKRARPTRSSLRGSLQQNGNDNIENNARVEHPAPAARTSGRRSLRRTGEDLPLNSAALYKLLEDVMKAENAWPFLRPVTQSEVPDYHKIIKNPMDLAKVKSKLNMGEYHLNEEVMNDIQLVFKNCQKYNEKDNEVYQAGRMLEKSVIELCKDLQLPYIPSSINK